MDLSASMKIAPSTSLRMRGGPEHGHLVTNFGDAPYTYTFPAKDKAGSVEVYVNTGRIVGGEQVFEYQATM